MEGFMLNQDRHTYRLRLDAKRGVLVSKTKNANGDWVEDQTFNGIKGTLTDAVVKYNENAEKHYLYLTFSHEGETLLVYSPFNNAILDLINRLAGPVDPMGRECQLKVWSVKLQEGSTAGIALYAENERCDWKYEPAEMQKVRQAGKDKWADMFAKFVKPKVDNYKSINLDPMATADTMAAQATSDNTEEADPDDLPF